MRMYYYFDGRGNVGDDLNPWLWRKLIPELIDSDDKTLFLGIGTLLNDKVPTEPRKIVFGSGLGYGTAPPRLDDRWKFYCVRGPLTARSLGLAPEVAITDPAALVATVITSRPPRNGGLAYMPHHISAWNADWESICKQVGIRYIDPRWTVDHVLFEIGRSSTLITEAMHGAILADTLRVPWSPVTCYEHILASKWMDWCQSLCIDYSPAKLPGVWNSDFNYSHKDRFKINIKRALINVGIRSSTWDPPPRRSNKLETEELIRSLEKLTHSFSPRLSTEVAFNRALDRLNSALHMLKRDFK